ncbi:discoidin domain-containing protein [Coraliomargarita sp. SDUM461004]|uniref:Discoidin domain-containing protein n=1 Tax=Thalassobacterium sedimentorum TaxID=3041258 RepID=A0ABU1AND3_9BACT|nr:discoidin domain-containing protein [Coraliomargarita sp. SDUM461004]MDQ8195708.1 discoidin domain-containing protein [Coraliomargarita sp. SDUM461004]
MRQPFNSEHLVLKNAVVIDGRVVVSERPLASKAFNARLEVVRDASFRKLFDGDYTSYWSPKSERGSIELDLGQNEEISAIEWDGYTYGESFPSEFSIYFRRNSNDNYKLAPAGILSGPSGSQVFSEANIVQNIDSHEVRLEFSKSINARFVKFVINKSSDGHPPRMTRLEVLGVPGEALGYVMATFAPATVEKWHEIRVVGENITGLSLRTRTSPETPWSEWQLLTSEDLSFLNTSRVSAIQVSARIENNRSGLGSLDMIEVDIDGMVMGAPHPTIPLDGSHVSSENPVLLWRSGVNAEYITNAVYEVQISLSPDFEESLRTDFYGVKGTELKLVNLNVAVGDTVFWRVRSASELEQGEAVWSEVSSFRISEVPRPIFNESRFGMNMGLDVRPWGKEMADEAGFSWSRLDFPWYKLQQSADHWNWSRSDKEVQVARDLEISILGILGYTPNFLSQQPDQRNARSYPPVHLEDWVAYITQVVTRYGTDVAVWEIWNEQNHRAFFSGTPQEFAHLLKAAYITIKNISPDALVTYGGHAGFSSRYLDSVVQEVGEQYFDIINWHCYPGMPDSEYFKKYLKLTGDYRAKLNGDKPIWLTEIGVSRSKKGDPPPQEIARRLVAHMAASSQLDSDGTPLIDKLFHFQFVEGHGYGSIQRYAMLIDYADPMTKPTVLPEFHAFAHALEIFDNATWLASSDLGGIVTHRFALSDMKAFTQVTVLWRSDGINHPVAFDVSADTPVELRNAFGEVVRTENKVHFLSNDNLYYVLSQGSLQISPVVEGIVHDK